MFTAAALRSFVDVNPDLVATRAELAALGIGRDLIAAQLGARRWQRVGTAIVLSNHPLNRAQQRRVACINCGPRAVLTAFTAAEVAGLQGWERDQVHVLAPRGTARPSVCRLDIRLHRVKIWDSHQTIAARRLHRLPPALLVAAGSFRGPRPAYGILAAAVQQRLVTAGALSRALGSAPNLRHHCLLKAAIADIAQGAQALSEIDFVRLCVSYGLPRPEQQTARRDPSGRRRYLDATWRLPDGRLLVVEVDGALHLAADRWWKDQLRQNDLALTGALVLRFPSVVVRTETALIARQLALALGVTLSGHGQRGS